MTTPSKTERRILSLLIISLCIGLALMAAARMRPFAPITITRSAGDPEPLSKPEHYQKKIDINRAAPSELEELDGIGPMLARKIAAYRSNHGYFKTTADIKSVDGIGQKLFERIEPSITVEEPR